MTEDDKKRLEAINNEADKLIKICFWFGVLPFMLLLMVWMASGVIGEIDFMLKR